MAVKLGVLDFIVAYAGVGVAVTAAFMLVVGASREMTRRRRGA